MTPYAVKYNPADHAQVASLAAIMLRIQRKPEFRKTCDDNFIFVLTSAMFIDSINEGPEIEAGDWNGIARFCLVWLKLYNHIEGGEPLVDAIAVELPRSKN